MQRTLIALLLAGLATAAPAAPIDSDIALARAALAAAHLGRSDAGRGNFDYEYDFFAGTHTEGDNIVRQAGAGSALAEYLLHSGDLGVAPRVAAALGFYRDSSAEFGGVLFVSSDGSVEMGNAGATALALLTELFYAEATGDERFAEQRGGWARALAALQLPSGGFARAPFTKQESPYFNGETWLALAHAARRFPQTGIEGVDLAAMLAAADAHMMATYAAEPPVGFVHWGLQTAAVRLATTGETRFADFLARVGETFIGTMRPAISPSGNSCSLVEGTAAAALALSDAAAAPDLVARLVERSRAEMEKNIELQVLPGQSSFDFGGGRRFTDPAMPALAGAFLNGRYRLQTRVDTTQHCLSALLKFDAMLRLVR